MPLICFASPKGGVGKTTMAANVAALLAARGRQVTAIDLDPQDSLGLHFGLVPNGHAGIRPDNPARFRRDRLIETSAGVRLLPHGRFDMEADVAQASVLAQQPEMLADPVRDILSDPGTVLIADMPPGPSAALAVMLPLTDLLVTVLLTDATSLAQIPSIESGQSYGRVTAEWFRAERMAFVLNQWDNRTRLGRAAGESASLHFGSRLLGTVYRDESVAEAIAAQRLVADYAPSSRAAQDLAALAEAVERRLMPMPAQAAAAPAWSDYRHAAEQAR